MSSFCMSFIILNNIIKLGNASFRILLLTTEHPFIDISQVCEAIKPDTMSDIFKVMRIFNSLSLPTGYQTPLEDVISFDIKLGELSR